LANGQGRTTQPLRSGPITGPSTPLRADPPLRSASVLSPSQLEPLGLLPSRRRRDGAQVLTFRTKAWSSFAPPTCRMSLGQSQASPELIPEEGSPPVLTSPNPLRHFCSGSLALASLDRACRILVPAFPQRSPPRLLTAAACGGLRSAPDCRTRRALLHLSYSCASPVLMAMLVTHDPQRTRVRLAPISDAIRVGDRFQFPGRISTSAEAMASSTPVRRLQTRQLRRM
jgi:hypothetical protein